MIVHGLKQALSVCVFGNIQCFCSRPVLDVWLFLAVLSPEPLAGFNCFIFPFRTLPVCMYICLPVSLPVTETGRRSLKTFVPRRTSSLPLSPRLQSYSLDKISRIPPSWKQCSRREEEREFVSVSFSLSISLDVWQGHKREEKLLLFKTSRGELKL